jgi:hypothetical protein
MRQSEALAAPAGSGVLKTREENAMGSERTRRAFIPVVLAAATLLAVLEVMAERSADLAPKPEASWSSSLHDMDAAIARGDLMAAAASGHEAYRAALTSRSWEAFLAAGDAALRLGEATQSRSNAEPDARRLYLTSLFRARSQFSLDGVLQATEAFARLGDHDVVTRGLSIARELAGSDPVAQARVREIADRCSREAVAAGERDEEGL